jgi:hypothetical protein
LAGVPALANSVGGAPPENLEFIEGWLVGTRLALVASAAAPAVSGLLPEGAVRMTQKPPPSSSLLTRAVRAGIVGIGSLAVFAGMSSGCLDRPVAPARPGTTNVFVDQIIQSAVDKIDLLFMIDNSRSMADKQEILAAAVPQLLGRLINPLCVDPTSGVISNPVGGDCPAPLEREFSAIDNIHIGVVTSSLGGHGADQCSPASGTQFDASQDDKAQLLPSVRPGLPQYGNTGFLVWDPSGKHQPQGETNSQALVTNFGNQVTETGEIGCGFEASLEAWYRFLIDPSPPLDVVQNMGQAEVIRPNNTVLQQRAAFLRPDSLVAVVMLTDENDCSTFDGGIAWLAGQSRGQGNSQFVLPKSTSACRANPNDPCCRSCNSIEPNGPPPGCGVASQDSDCVPNSYHDERSDELNLRCWDQKRRFGIPFLYGVGRYIEGLTSLTVHNSTGQTEPNPLYMDLTMQNQPARPQSLVFLAGIIGVPWQDLATEETRPDNVNDLKYLTAAQIGTQGRWPMILGDPDQYILPSDPLMIESPFPRTEQGLGINPNHPIAGLPPLMPPPSAGGQLRGNPINGNEYFPPRINDLQYSCIFPLNAPRQCGMIGGCDCSTTDQGMGKPLCNGTDQTHAKGYPGLRHLQVLRGIGNVVPTVNNAIVASICPKITQAGNPAYGYNPAVAAIIERLKEQLGGKCLPRPLEVQPDGTVPCAIVEAIYSPTGTPDGCSCDNGAGRYDLLGGPYEALAGPVQSRLESIKQCGGQTGRDCAAMCLCEIAPAADGAPKQACLNDTNAVNAGNLFGYCYVDENSGAAPEILAKCPPAQKQKLQFIGQNTPAKGSVAFIACLGKPIADQDSGVR